MCVCVCLCFISSLLTTAKGHDVCTYKARNERDFYPRAIYIYIHCTWKRQSLYLIGLHMHSHTQMNRVHNLNRKYIVTLQGAHAERTFMHVYILFCFQLILCMIALRHGRVVCSCDVSTHAVFN